MLKYTKKQILPTNQIIRKTVDKAF
ncbi:uncharacterized protein METZ01_LOCUS30492 [marine metagenome]|uniref:Uncharacterized protein n=1 Tax=marine metagenome TaxID=408172 RepID=A0A381QF76_9ZZZZ